MRGFAAAVGRRLACSVRGQIRIPAMATRSITSRIGMVLLVFTAINFYVGASIAQLAWDEAHGHFAAQADFSIAMHIAAVSLPIAALCLVGLGIGTLFRFGSDGILVPALCPSLVSLAVVNILAPLLLWYALKWVA
jgi:hypothetical protein